MCLTTDGTTPTTAVAQHPCTPASPTQHWQFTTTSPTTVAIRNTTTNHVLTAPPTPQHPVTHTPYTAHPTQHWTTTTVGNTLHDIAPLGSYISIRSITDPPNWSIHNNNGDITLTHITTTTPEHERQAATWKLVPGLADTTCYSFESTTTPGTYLTRTTTARITLSSPNAPFAATWCAEKAAYGQGISFSNHHDMFRLIRNANNHIWAGAPAWGGQPHADNPTNYTQNTAWTITAPWTTPPSP